MSIFKYNGCGNVHMSGYCETHSKVTTRTQIGTISTAAARPVSSMEMIVEVSDGNAMAGTALIDIQPDGKISVSNMTVAGYVILRFCYCTGK